MQAAAHENSGLALRALVRDAPRDVSRVIVVSVVDEALSRVLDAAARRRFGVMPEYIRSTRARLRRHQQLSRYLAPRSGSLGVGGRRACAGDGARRGHRQRRHRAHHRRRLGRAAAIVAAPSFRAPRPWWRACSPARMASGAARRAVAPIARSLFATDTASALAAGSHVRRRGVHRSRGRSRRSAN